MSTGLIEGLAARAGADPRRIVLPEADDPHVLEAAQELHRRGIAVPVLLGDPAAVAAAAALHGLDLTGVEIVDAGDPDVGDRTVHDYLATGDRLSEKALHRKLKHPLNLACAFVVTGHADAVAAGRTVSTGEVILAAQVMIGLQEGVETVSSIGIVEAPGFDGPEGDLLAVADCAVCTNPGPRELADIAAASAQTVTDLLGWRPRVALLSFSTRGSGDDPLVTKVRQALAVARERFPDLCIDGDLQFDAAVDPAVAARKVTGDSPVAGRANVVVFPDLNAGNIGVKLIQRFGRAVAHGPLLQGFAAPVSDFSRGAPVEEMIGNLTMLAVRAQRARPRALQTPAVTR